MPRSTTRAAVLAALIVPGTVEDVCVRLGLAPDLIAQELRRLSELGIVAGRLDHEGVVYRLRRPGMTVADVEVAERVVRGITHRGRAA